MAFETKPDRPDLDVTRLLQAIAQRADRDAFTALFQHFAPRVKSFMVRSGATANPGGGACPRNVADGVAQGEAVRRASEPALRHGFSRLRETCASMRCGGRDAKRAPF